MFALDKLDLSNCQQRICPPFAKRLEWSNYPTMADAISIESIRDALRKAMLLRGIKPTSLSLQVGRNRTLVKDLLEKTNDINISTLNKLAGALDVPLSDLLASPRVPIVGYIGAGGEVIFEEFSDDEGVLRPPGISGTLEALVVRGSSMLPKYKDGDIIYIQNAHGGIIECDIGDDCAVRLSTGETYVKQLMRGNEDGKFTLFSLNAPPIENMEVEWATRVLFIMPARSRSALP